ncbi:MAG: SDR family oxidoreductase [Planctomycetes bacterium]|nr:SDR family oxidoreductase [Planctomycetota bacterium]
MSWDLRGRRVLVAGAGDVGVAAGLLLHAAGATVFGARRTTAAVPPPLQPVAVDLLAPDAFAALPPDLDALVWAVAPHIHDPEAYRRSYTEGPARLAAALLGRGDALQRVVLVASTSVYGHQRGEVVDEQTSPQPSSFAGEAILAGERALAALPVRTTSLRFAGIYGPGRTWLIERVRRGHAAPPTAARFGNRIHRDDGAAAIAHVLTLDDPAPCYVVVDDDPADLREVYAWLAARLGVPLPPASDDDATTRRGGNKRCDNRLLRATGWRPRYPSYRDGYAAMLG